MIMHKILSDEVEDKSKPIRSSIGGYPILGEGQEWPKCKICDDPQALFFQFDIDEKFELPFIPGSHMVMFMCLNHDEPTYPPLLSDTSGKLPDVFWESSEEETAGQYTLILNKPGISENTLKI
jgi:hypothetical protein